MGLQSLLYGIDIVQKFYTKQDIIDSILKLCSRAALCFKLL